jgi:hypothetical protein
MIAGRETTWVVVLDRCLAAQKLERVGDFPSPKFRVTDTGIVDVDDAVRGAHAHEDAKLSVLDVCRLSHSRLQLDHLAIHSEPAVSVMVDGLRILLRRIDPGPEHFRDEEIVLVDEAGTLVAKPLRRIPA